MPNEIKIGDMKDDIEEDKFESGSELESMLTEEFKSSIKLKTPLKAQQTHTVRSKSKNNRRKNLLRLRVT